MSEELKTLKEMNESPDDREPMTHHAHLRQEAIKWLKEEIEIFGRPMGIHEKDCILRWMKRLNLTGEDLK